MNSCRPFGPYWFVGYAKPRPRGRGYCIAALRASGVYLLVNKKARTGTNSIDKEPAKLT